MHIVLRLFCAAVSSSKLSVTCSMLKNYSQMQLLHSGPASQMMDTGMQTDKSQGQSDNTEENLGSLRAIQFGLVIAP